MHKREEPLCTTRGRCIKRCIFLTSITILMMLGCTKTVPYDKLMPAELDIADIRKVAVAEFDGLYQSGRIIASKVAAGIIDGGRYRLFEREKLAEILAEHDLYEKGVGFNPTTTRKLKLHGVDALIFGVVDAYNIADQRGTSLVEKKVGTGEYRKVEHKDTKTGKTEYREEEIVKAVLWNRPYVLRQGTVGVTFRMANIGTGEVVAVESMTSNFSKRAWHDEVNRELPSKDAILDSLASEVVRRFLNKIQPYTVKASVKFEATGDSHSKLGITYAKNGLWDKALEEFEMACRGKERDPSAYYNLGMVYYVMGNYVRAVSLVERAIDLDPKKRYIKALAMIRQDMENR